jgi:hypothetical protein
MSFSEFVDFGNDVLSDNQCAEHPDFPMPAECMTCTFIHYEREHEAGATQMAGTFGLPSSHAPEQPCRGLYSDEPKENAPQRNIQMSGSSDVPTTRYLDLPTNVFWSNAPQQNHFQNPVQSATGYATPIVKYSKPQNTGFYSNILHRNAVKQAMRYAARLGKYPQPPRNRPDQTALQLAMRHMAPMAPTVKRSYRSTFPPKIISTIILSKTPAQIDIDPRLLDDHYPERFALSPTYLPKRFAKLALPVGQESNSEEDAEYEIDLETAKATEADHESKEEKVEAMQNLAYYLPLFGFTGSDLRKRLQSRGLPTGGKKADLIARLLEFGLKGAEVPVIVVEKKSIEKSSEKPSPPSRRSTRSSKTPQKGTTRSPRVSPRKSPSSASRIAFE